MCAYNGRPVADAAALCGGAVERDHLFVERPLIEVCADQCFRDFAVDVRDRLPYAFALIPRLVAIAQFQRFALTRRGTGRYCSAAEPTFHPDVNFNGRIAARIENFARVNIENFHWCSLRVRRTPAVGFGFSAERLFRDWPNQRFVLGCNHDDASFGHGMTTPVFFDVISNKGSAWNEDVAIDDRSANACMTPHADAGHQNRLLDFAEAVHAHVRTQDASHHPASRDDAAA
jgi:hypothetical protein